MLHIPTAVVPLVDVHIDWARHFCWSPGHSHVQSIPLTHSFMWLMLNGTANARTERRVWPLLPGTVLLNSGCTASISQQSQYCLVSSGAEWLEVGFRATLFDHINLLHSVQTPLVWKPREAECQVLELWMRQLVGEWANTANSPTVNPIAPSPIAPEIYGGRPGEQTGAGGVDGSLIVQGLGQAIFGLCWRMLASGDEINETHHAVPGWLGQAMQHRAKQPDTTILQWANATGFSMPQFRRLFHQWVGMSPQQYLTQHRIEVAQQLLKTTDLTMGRIALQVGFESVSHFTRLFKRHCAVSPARYRQVARNL